MEKIIEIAFSGFWQFVGMCILVGIPLNFIFRMYNRTLRCLNLKRNGWPPEHVDADGDFKEAEDSKDEN